MVEFLEMSMVLFGPFVLARPVRLSDFSSKEMRLLRKGRYQFAPFPDKSGRRVLCVFLDKEWVAFPMEAKARMSLYMSWTAGDDVDTQRKGLVVLTWFDQNFEVAGRSNIEYKDHTFSCVRACAIHMCSPDTPMYQLLRAIVITNLGRAKQKLRVHLGSTEEIFLVLQSFGITIDQLPIGLSGIIKNERVKEWLRSRCCIEESLKPSPDGSLSSTSDIIEYPKKDDVLFRMGMSNTAHPGNAFFRHHLETTMTRHGKMRASAGKAKDLRKRYICEIIFHIKHSIGGRFLDWNKQLEGWTEMHDDEQIKRKIENLVKRSKGVAKSEIRRQLHNGKTSMIKKIDKVEPEDQVNEKNLLQAVNYVHGFC
mmetsp:Transcript_110800/g.226757  ORF Transcript_110800/g.226757 Transcript_110800/m.226757 type:complete len:366 (+) Transcript_110800:3-1100(+)